MFPRSGAVYTMDGISLCFLGLGTNLIKSTGDCAEASDCHPPETFGSWQDLTIKWCSDHAGR